MVQCSNGRMSQQTASQMVRFDRNLQTVIRYDPHFSGDRGCWKSRPTGRSRGGGVRHHIQAHQPTQGLVDSGWKDLHQCYRKRQEPSEWYRTLRGPRNPQMNRSVFEYGDESNDSTSESEVMTPMTRSDETVDIGQYIESRWQQPRAGSNPAYNGSIFKHIGVWRTLLKTSEGRTLYSVFEYGKVMCYSVQEPCSFPRNRSSAGDGTRLP